ncbi:MAG: GTPase HflX [Eubacteriales bacterium]
MENNEYGKVHGNIEGIKKSIIKELEDLYSADMEILRHKFVSDDVVYTLCQITEKINKEISIYIARDGMVMDVSVGSHDRVGLPDLRVRRGKRRLTGIRCIHTHPNESGVLSTVDIKTLQRMRFDSMAAIGVRGGLATSFQAGILTSLTDSGDYETTLYGPYQYNSIPHQMLLDEIEYASEQISKAANILDSMETEEERAILVGVGLSSSDTSSLDELARLADTAGAKVLYKELQNRNNIDSATYIGKGKVQELALLRQSMEANLFVFDDELTGAQIRNLENAIGCKVIDRTSLILDIFASRASTHEGKLQVELAQYKYRLPRLSGIGTQLSRLGGGIGTRGPGETKLESDRRAIYSRIHDLETQVKKLKKRRDINRVQRIKNAVPIIALVGYTNAGKSTLLNAITSSDVTAEDKLFATLDPVTRSMTLPKGTEILVTDTVGFINKLPHDLIDAFRSTLEEAVFADILVHVVDGSSPEMEMQFDVAKKVLESLGAGDKKRIIALNKMDLAEEDNIPLFEEGEIVVHISATQKTGFDKLFDEIEKILHENTKVIETVVPYANGTLSNYIFENAEIIEKEYRDEGTYIKARVTQEVAMKIASLEKEK